VRSGPYRLWGRSADYELLAAGEPAPARGIDASARRSVESIRRLLERIIEEYPGNHIVLAARVQRKLAIADEEITQVVARMLASGYYSLWEFPHARPIGRTRPVTPSPDAPSRGPAQPRPLRTWIEVGVVDQMGRPLPWMQAWLTLPSGSRRERALDGQARTREDELEQSGLCTFEVRARPGMPRQVRPPQDTAGRVGMSEPTWIAVRVVDQFGRAVPGLRARTIGADGSKLARDLDDNAVARLYPLPTGDTCTIEVVGRGVKP
jgi:hypothetical protein